MTDPEFRISISTDDQQLGIVVSSPLHSRELGYDIPFAPLTTEQLHDLRLGNASEALVAEMQKLVSEWLLSKQARRMLAEALKQRGEGMFRLELAIEDIALYVKSGLAAMPIELLCLGGEDVATRAQPTSIAHVIHSDQKGLLNRSSPDLLRVLIVRASPSDGPPVPEARLLQEQILSRSKASDERAIQVDVLSSERLPAGAVSLGAPTYRGLQKLLAMQTTGYDVLVFLGHGYQDQEGAKLLFEGERGEEVLGEAITPKDLARLLYDHPIPIVLLVSCASGSLGTVGTHEQAIGIQHADALDSEIERWIDGSLGIAQRLIYDNTGVHISVGMRYRLTDTDALQFLEAFFHALLRGDDVEHAVYMGRRRLTRDKSYSWSAPIVFRTPAAAPPLLQSRRANEASKEPADNEAAAPPLHSATTAESRVGGYADDELGEIKELLKLYDGLKDHLGQMAALLVGNKREIQPYTIENEYEALAALRQKAFRIIVTSRKKVEMHPIFNAFQSLRAELQEVDSLVDAAIRASDQNKRKEYMDALKKLEALLWNVLNSVA